MALLLFSPLHSYFWPLRLSFGRCAEFLAVVGHCLAVAQNFWPLSGIVSPLHKIFGRCRTLFGRCTEFLAVVGHCLAVAQNFRPLSGIVSPLRRIFDRCHALFGSCAEFLTIVTYHSENTFFSGGKLPERSSGVRPESPLPQSLSGM